MDCMATIREAPPQLRQAAYATQPADAAGPNAATDDNHAGMPPGANIISIPKNYYP